MFFDIGDEEVKWTLPKEQIGLREADEFLSTAAEALANEWTSLQISNLTNDRSRDGMFLPLKSDQAYIVLRHAIQLVQKNANYISYGMGQEAVYE